MQQTEELSKQKIKPSNNSLSPKTEVTSCIAVKCKGSCLKQDKITFTSRNAVNLFIAYELDAWSRDLKTVIFLKDYVSSEHLS